MDVVENQAEGELQETAKSENQEETCETDEKKEVRDDDFNHSQTCRGLTLRKNETVMGARLWDLSPHSSRF